MDSCKSFKGDFAGCHCPMGWLTGRQVLNKVATRGSSRLPVCFNGDGDAGDKGQKNSSGGVEGSQMAGELGADLRKRMQTLYAGHVKEDGNGVDYAGIAQSAELEHLTELTRKLQEIDLERMSQSERKALFLNLYNVLLIHAVAVSTKDSGLAAYLPSSARSLYQKAKTFVMFGAASYRVGDYLFSLNEMEHGILRENTAPPSKFSSNPFTSSDPRLPLALALDPRIHFALNCGAKSCPAIRFYDGDKLETQLDRATRAYCSQEVTVDEKTRTVQLSEIYRWYAGDFIAAHQAPAQGGGRGARGERVVLEWVERFLEEDSAMALRRLLDSAEELTVVYSKYDWTRNQSSESG